MSEKTEATGQRDQDMMLWSAALAIAEVVRSYDQPTMAKSIMSVCGVSVKEAKRVGVDEFDLRELRKAERA